MGNFVFYFILKMNAAREIMVQQLIETTAKRISRVFNWSPWIITFFTALIGIDNGNIFEMDFRANTMLFNGQKTPKIILKFYQTNIILNSIEHLPLITRCITLIANVT